MFTEFTTVSYFLVERRILSQQIQSQKHLHSKFVLCTVQGVSKVAGLIHIHVQVQLWYCSTVHCVCWHWTSVSKVMELAILHVCVLSELLTMNLYCTWCTVNNSMSAQYDTYIEWWSCKERYRNRLLYILLPSTVWKVWTQFHRAAKHN